MDDFFAKVLLAVIQGISEAFPVSSSGHVCIVARFLGIPVGDSMGLEVAYHVGGLAAIAFVFRGKVADLFRAAADMLALNFNTERARFAFAVAISFIPAGAVGYAVKSLDLNKFLSLNDPKVIAMSSVLFAILMFVCDFFAEKRERPICKISFIEAFVFGAFQAFAIVPGASRLGMCFTAGRILGYSRPDSVTFSFIMGIPTILGAITLSAVKSGGVFVRVGGELFLGAVLSAMLTAAFIPLFVKMVSYEFYGRNDNRFNIGVFSVALYRILLGVVVIFSV
ncbi:undecaprenyl-diphosphate phosphatase [Candidatus Hydrogenosomobacter endosymbioticus]|uniref:Undecaprenyl-diphosphatase n=1 Tax=Candidatus Hydrogenosomobacter endosymbioticus TaxID=2558174 RepID=A0ABN6L305_9PROT|nr:undecaprenyl-diphosphate phosphatase [Candidatus Hydrogenosomobacter endosymbioticus]BDB96262.1 undecaprenyl-diphosphatase [Candidatus Hydrogenosomobacter endosymbioticus]